MDVEVKRSGRRTMSLEVTPDCRVIVRAPYRVGTDRIDAFVRSRQDWILRNLRKMAVRREAGEQTAPLTDAERKELYRRASEVIPERVAHYAGRMGVTWGRITLRMQKTRWGSCSGTGNLNFNVLLMLAPPEVMDYVVVHELSHRKHMDHSAAFWAEVESVLPDYRERRRWLRDHGAELMAKRVG